MNHYRIVNHFSQEIETHKYLGLTQGGAPVYIDRTYLESDLKVTTALIEPHLMAGYFRRPQINLSGAGFD